MLLNTSLSVNISNLFFKFLAKAFKIYIFIPIIDLKVTLEINYIFSLF